MPNYLLEQSSWVIVAAIGLIAIAVVAPLTAVALRRGTAQDRSNDNVCTAALRLSGGALILISSFSAVAVWQAERDHELATEDIDAAIGRDTAPADEALVALQAAVRARAAKITQVVASTAVVVALLAMVVIIGSPSLNSSSRSDAIAAYLQDLERPR